MSFIFFESDDEGYLDWVNQHPTSFVLNVRKDPDPNYIVLHQASCLSVTRPLTHAGGYTGRDYRKIVAETEQELRSAAVHQGRRDGTFSSHCSQCFGAR